MTSDGPSRDAPIRGSGQIEGEAPAAAMAGADRRDLRARIAANPELVLGDPVIMQALLESESGLDRRVRDLRDVAITRLEQKLARLMAAHRDIVDVAMDNISGMEQAQEAVLALIGGAPVDGDPLHALAERVRDRLPHALGLDAARLCISDQAVLKPRRSPPERRPRSGGVDPSTARIVRKARLAARRGGAAGGALARTLDALRSSCRQLNTLDGGASSPTEFMGRAEAPQRSPAAPGCGGAVLAPALARLQPSVLAALTPPRTASGAPGGAREPAILLRGPEAVDAHAFGPDAAACRSIAAIRIDIDGFAQAAVLMLGAQDPERFRGGAALEALTFVGGVAARMIRLERAAAPSSTPDAAASRERA